MTRTDYQAHLINEYQKYIQKSIKDHENEEVKFIKRDLANSLIKAFEKGVMKGILFESVNDFNFFMQQVDGTDEELKLIKSEPEKKEFKIPEKIQIDDKTIEDVLNRIFGWNG